MVFYFTEGDGEKENGDTGNACPEELPSEFSFISCEQDGVPVLCIMGECIPDATVFCEEGFDCPFDKGCAVGDGTDFFPITGRECQKDGKYGRCDMSGKCNIEPDDEPLICGGINCVEYMEELFAEIPEEERIINGMVISAPPKECMTCVDDMCSVGEMGVGLCAVDGLKECVNLGENLPICIMPKTCVDDSECPQCRSCIGGVCQSGGGACTTSDGKPGVCDWYDDCNDCDTTYFIEMGDGCTEACPNRVESSNGEFCVLPCSGNTPLADRWGYCHTCEDEYNVPVLGDDKCSEICDNRERIGNECRPKCGVGKLADKPLYGCVEENNSYDYCYEESKTCSACGEKVYVGQGGKCSEVCPGYVLSPGGYCVPACPKDTPLMDSDGDCYACDEEDPVYIVDKDNWSSDYCSKICSNRIEKSDYCSLPCGSGIYKDKPLTDYDASCHSCDENEGFWIGYNDGQCTELCDNRVADNGYCYLKCGEGTLKDTPLMDHNGVCYPCNVEDDVYIYNVGKCTEVCSNRIKYGNYCYPKCGEGEFEGKPLLGDDGKCYACDYYDDIYVYEFPCSEVCEDRYKKGSYCYPKCGVGVFKDMPLKDYSDRCYSCTTTESVIVYDGSCTTSCPNRRASGSFCYLK